MSTSYRFEDFIVDAPIGQGAFGVIYKATEQTTGHVYALKAVNRRFLIKMKKQNLPMIEKTAMTKSASPFVVKLYGTFKDDSNLYFVFEYAEHGDLAEAISDLGSLSSNVVKIVSAQLLVAISAVHAAKIIHRDLKPENVLLDSNNHVKLTDFGDARILDQDTCDLQRSSIVGTPAFTSPELVNEGKISFDSDLWSYGCFIFNLLTGEAPFAGDNPATLMSNISSLKFVSAFSKLPEIAKNLIQKLLVIQPSARLGHGEEKIGYPSIRNHPFFKGIDWDHLSEVKMPVFTAFDEARENSMASSLLAEGEMIQMEGTVERKRMLRWKKRVIVVTSLKRFLLFNVDTKKIKLEFLIERGTKVEVSSNGQEWTISWDKGKKSQTFKSPPGMASIWAATIMKLSLS